MVTKPRRKQSKRSKRSKLTPLGEIVVDVATLAVAAFAFTPEIIEALELKQNCERAVGASHS